jgi:hypothetical protein
MRTPGVREASTRIQVPPVRRGDALQRGAQLGAQVRVQEQVRGAACTCGSTYTCKKAQRRCDLPACEKRAQEFKYRRCDVATYCSVKQRSTLKSAYKSKCEELREYLWVDIQFSSMASAHESLQEGTAEMRPCGVREAGTRFQVHQVRSGDALQQGTQVGAQEQMQGAA